jgi:hypothetical protein
MPWGISSHLLRTRKESKMPSIPFLLFLAISLTGCSHDPSLEISGSFFPAWMISILIGIVATMLAHRLFVWLGVDPFLKPYLVVYGALALSLTLATWLLFYS